MDIRVVGALLPEGKGGFVIGKIPESAFYWSLEVHDFVKEYVVHLEGLLAPEVALLWHNLKNFEFLG